MATKIEEKREVVTSSNKREIREKRGKLVRRKMWLETGRREEAIKVNLRVVPGPLLCC